MEKFTNPKRVLAPVGGIGTPLQYRPTTNEQLLPLLLLSFFTLLSGAVLAQPFNQATGFSNPLNGFNAGNRSVPVFVDIDNDCDKDLFVGNQSGVVLFYKNTGTASAPVFVLQSGAANPLDGFSVSSNAKPAFVDIDADGDLDCFIGSGDGTISAFKNEGTVSAPSFVEQTGPNTVFFDGNPFDGEDVGSNASPAFMDFDNDGDYDCFVGRSNSTNSIRYYRNEDGDYNPMFNELTGSDNPLSNTAVILGGIGANGNITSNACITAVDFGTGNIPDGDFDIYVGVANGTFRYFRNNGSSFTHFASGSASSPLDNGGTPYPKDVSGSGTDYSSPTFVDIDGDGDLDCFSGRNNGAFVFYRNDAMVTARVITCAPTYLVNLDANGLATVNPATVDPNDLFLSTTFNCLSELTFTVTGTGVLSFSCLDADNDAMTNGNPENTLGMPPTSLVLTATDAAMNTATCSTTITVLDKTPPVPDEQTLAPQTIDVCDVRSFPGDYFPTATDACGCTLSLRNAESGIPCYEIEGVPTPSILPGTVGQTTVTWTYTDDHGNTSTQTQVFNVVSNVAPTWTGCPANIGPLFANQGAPNCGLLPSAPLWTIPVAEDCEDFVSTSSHTPTSFFPVGVTTVTYVAQDAGGNTGFCNFTVTVTDNMAPTVTVVTGPRSTTAGNPVIMSGSSIPLNSSQGVCGAAFSWLPPSVTATDDCGGPVTFSVNYPSGTIFPVGSTVVNFTASDVGGNTTTYWTFTVVVTDVQPPSITCPVSITIPTAPNSCTSATINLTLPVASDNCPIGFSVVRTTDGTYATTSPMGEQPPLAVSLPIGAHTFFFKATDASMNSNVCSYTITVADQQAPSFGNTCPPSQVVAADGNGCTKTGSLWTVPTATDNCALMYTPVATLTFGNTSTTVSGTEGMPVPSTTFNEGITTVTYTVYDGATPTSNSAVCTFTIQVTNTIPPTISCPIAQPVVVDAGADCLYTLSAIAGVGSTATAPCDPGKITYRNAAGAPLTLGVSTFPLGTHILTAIATDVSNNSATCSVSIQVKDNTGPVLQNQCPADITVYSDANAACGANVTWTAPVWTDNCNNAGIVVSHATSPIGLHTPNNATILNSNAGGFFPVGKTQVNFTAKDGPAITANIGTPCGFTVTVIDDDKPVVTCATSPVVVTATAFSSCNNVYTLYVPTVTDNGCSTALSVTYSTTGVVTTSGVVASTPTVTLPIGSTTITYSVTDTSGNTGTCSYTVQVKDLTGPVFSCPSSQIIVLTSGCSGPAASWMDPVTTSDCSLPVFIGAPTVQSTTGTPAPVINGISSARNGVFPAGVTTLRYTAYDNAIPSNSSTCTFTIDVRENIAPTISCPPAITVNSTNCQNAAITANLFTVLPTASDNCALSPTNPVAILSPTLPTTFSLFAESSYFVTWVATDANGNTATCTQTVVVRDDTDPVLTCPTPYTAQLQFNQTAFDICANAGLLGLPSVSDCAFQLPITPVLSPQQCQFTPGSHPIYWQATDDAGNTGTCIQTLIVIATPSCIPATPSFAGGSNCGSVTPFVLPNANCPAMVTVTAAQLGLSALDNCGNTLNIGNQTITVNATGVQTVTFTAMVGANTASCTRTVSVTCNSGPCVPNAAPTMAGCGGVISVPANSNCQGTVASFGVTAIDNCAFITVTASNNGPFALGNTTVTFTATNTAGTNSCTKTVTVSDVTDPVIVSCPMDVTIAAEIGEEYAFSGNLDAPTATDNCSVATIELSVGTPDKLFGDGEVVTWVITDGSGNFVECQQNITVSTSVGGVDGCADALGIEVATDGSAGDLYGYSVDVDGSRAIVGAPYDDNGKGINSGAAYILEKDGLGNWVEVAKIISPDGDADDHFGESVAIKGGLVIIGSSKYVGKGAAFIFSGAGASWSLVTKLLASDGAANDDFGTSVDITSTHAIVGAPNDDAPKVNQGSAYIFGKDTGGANNWGQIVKKVASDGDTNDNYGISVSIDGSYAVVGSRYDDDFGTNSGSAYVLDGTSSWMELQKLTASDAAAGDYFGNSVAISGIHIIVGSYLDDYGALNNAGSAYIFEDSGLSWAEVAKLIPSDAAAADQFGISVAIEGGTAVIGSHFNDDMGTNSGSAYVFTENSGWSEVNKLLGASVTTNDNFGRSVGIGGSSVVIGAYKDDAPGLDQGSAYFFGCSNTQVLREEAKERTDVATSIGGQVRCFPNPSTDMVNIDITLASEENVQVFVSDITGKVISTLFDNKMSGENRLQWEGKQFGNGMYFIRVQSASLREVVPVVIVR